MLNAGGNQPHPNMPPYIVLNACKKISEEFTSALINQNSIISSMNSTINLLNQNLGAMNLSSIQ